jgi:hypothetical protein
VPGCAPRVGELGDELLGWWLPRYASDLGNRLKDQGFCAVDVIAVTDADVVLQATYIEGGVDGHRVGEQLGIGNDHAAAIVRLEQCGTRLNVFDRSLEVAHDDLVANDRTTW